MKRKIIPIFVPHEGCPHDCIFCNQKKITGFSTSMTGEKAESIILEHLSTLSKKKEKFDIEIAFFGGSFTAIETKKQIELLTVAKKYKDMGIVKDIRMSTRPDCIDEDILKLIQSYGASIIELGVQSMDENVLIQSLRGHDREIVKKSSQLIKDYGFKLGLQQMIGLPGDSEEKSIRTAEEFVRIKPNFVRIYPTLVIKETGLERAYLDGYYNPFSLEESIEISRKLIAIYVKNNIDVIRVGLQATDDIKEGEDVVCGPYHPSFRELVHSRMIRDYLEKILPDVFEEIVISSANRNMSMIVGNKRSNRKFINDKYNARFKTIINDENIDSMKVSVDGKCIREINFTELKKELYDIYKL